MGVWLKPLAWGLGIAAVVTTVGIGVFVVRPSFSETAARTASPPPGAPNIIFITLDTVRADHLSAYGYARPTTPNLDRFARTGVLFENAIAPTSWTLASHASMFTGLLPQQHGADWAVPLASSPWTLAEILRSWGYETAGFPANLLYLQRGWGISQGFDTYICNSDSIGSNLSATLIGNAIVEPIYQNLSSYDWFYRQDAKELNRKVYKWLRKRSKQPYFLFINYFDAHEPYLPPRPFDDRFGKTSMSLTRRFVEALVNNNGGTMKFSMHDRKLLVDAYDNCLAYLDIQVGDLLNFLHRSPEWHDTIVIITSDHGEEFGGHGYYSHGSDTYRETLHVPLIIAGPGIPQGLRIGHLVGTRQLFATVLYLAGRGKSSFRRYSLTRFWNPAFKPTPSDNAVVSELVPDDDLTGEHAMVSLTTPQWQYIEHRSGRQELYNWTVDPKEKDNLASSPQEQATLANLRSRLISLVSNATGPWRGVAYLQALDKVGGTSRLSLLFPRPFHPGAAGNQFRIGVAQAYFESQASTLIQSSQSEHDVMKGFPYQ